MSILASDSFAVALFSLMKLGQEARNAYVDKKIANDANLQALGTTIFSTIAAGNPITKMADIIARSGELDATSEPLRNWAAKTAASAGLFDPNAEYEGVVALMEGVQRVPKYEQNKLLVRDEARFVEVIRMQIMKAPAFAKKQKETSDALIALQQTEWLNAHKAAGGKIASPWTAFASNMLKYSLDTVAADPKLLGGGRNAQKIIAAVVPTIAQLHNSKVLSSPDLAARLPTVFAQAAMGLLIEKPELVSSEARWQRLITGVLTPLQAEVARVGDVAAFAAEGRVRELIEGELAPVALRIISENSDDYLKGGASGDRIAGVVLRATLGDYTSTDAASDKVRTLFGREGIERIVFHSIDAARSRPELFFRQSAGKAPGENELKLLQSVAGLFISGDQRINPFDGTLATNFYCIALDSVSAYLMSRVTADPNKSLQSQMGAELATYLIRDITTGIRDALTTPGGANGLTLLRDRFGHDKLGDIFKIIADYASRSPDMMLGKDKKNALLVDVSRMIASAILEDTDGLLSPDQWKSVALASVDAALENPNTLFGKLMGNDQEDFIARKLIQLLVRKAKANFEGQKGTAGQIFFGKVLEEAIIATLDAASTGVLAILAEKVQVEERLAAVEGLIDKLNALAASKDPSMIIGSGDWIRIYTRHVTDVLHRGKAALDQLTDPALLEAIMDNSVRTGTSEGMG